MRYPRSALLALLLGSASAMGNALAPTLGSITPAAQLQTGAKTGGKGGRKSVARKMYHWWKAICTSSSKVRNPSDPVQAALISAAQAKRHRRAVKLARDSRSYC